MTTPTTFSDNGRAAPKRSLMTMFIRYYPQLLDAIIKVSDAFLALVRNVLVSFGIPVVLLMIISVEIPRVAHGVGFLEPDERFAYLTAAVIVISNKVIEFLIVYEQTKAGELPEYYLFSVRRMLIGLRDIIFKKRAAPAAHRYIVMSNFITATILLMALLGSMRVAIAELPDMVWYEALWDIVANSNLQRMLTWTSGTVLTAALVVIARGLAHYIAVDTTHVIDELKENRTVVITQQQKVQEARTEIPNEGYIIRNAVGQYTAYSTVADWNKSGYTSIQSATSGVRSYNSQKRKQLQEEG